MKSVEEETGISIYKIFSMVWYRLPMIIVCALITGGLFFGVACISKDRYPVYATVKVNKLEGVEQYSMSEIMYFFKDEKNLERYVTDKHKLKSLKKDFQVSLNGSTGYIDFVIENTDDPDYWFDLINDSVSDFNEYLDSYYNELALKRLDKLSNDIEEISVIMETSENKDIYGELVLSKSSLVAQIKKFKHSLSFISVPYIGERTNKGDLTMGVLGTLLGGVIGLICTLIAGFTDNRIMLAEDLVNIIGSDRLMLSIPEYKDFSKFDSRHAEYLASSLSKDCKSVLVTSISSNSGVSTISEGLKSCCKHTEIEIIDGGALVDKPSIITKIKQADKTFVLVHDGVDTKSNVKQFDRILRDEDCGDVSYVYNFTTNNERNSMRYLPLKNYSRRKFMFW